jgi:hypothetical protein
MRAFSILFVLFNSLLISVAEAQLHVGAVVGGGASKVSFYGDQSDYESSPTLGYDAGLMASMRVHKNFVLNAQLLYAQRGTHVTGKLDPIYDLTSRMQYIDLPIYYVLEFKNISKKQSTTVGLQKSFNWFFGAGPTISYWLGNSGTLKSSNLKENQIESLHYTTVFDRSNSSFDPTTDATIESISLPNRFQFAINISGGFGFEPTPGRKIVTTIHLNFAQSFLSDKGNGFFVGSPIDVDLLNVNNHSIRFSLAYLFDMKLETKDKGKSMSKLGSKTKKKKR